jgi:hypothetical protein
VTRRCWPPCTRKLANPTKRPSNVAAYTSEAPSGLVACVGAAAALSLATMGDVCRTANDSDRILEFVAQLVETAALMFVTEHGSLRQ